MAVENGRPIRAFAASRMLSLAMLAGLVLQSGPMAAFALRLRIPLRARLEQRLQCGQGQEAETPWALSAFEAGAGSEALSGAEERTSGPDPGPERLQAVIGSWAVAPGSDGAVSIPQSLVTYKPARFARECAGRAPPNF